METTPLTPSDRFNRLIEGLFSDVQTRLTNGWFPEALVQRVLIKLIWRRLRRLSRRFAAIMAQFRAGTLPQSGTLPEAGSAPRRPAGSSHRPRPQQPSRLFGWVIYAVSYFVWLRHYELDEMLEDPEMAAQVADAPQLGSVLRPMCQMLAVKPPPWLRLPRRPRRRRVVEIPPAPDFLLNTPGAILKPDGTVWLRVGASTLWKPGFGETLEQAQKFDAPIRIWPRTEWK